MRRIPMLVLLASIAAAVRAESEPIRVEVCLEERLGPMEIDRFALGQGGLSEDPMWDDRIAEIRALRPRLIRLFVQDYFDLLPERGRYHFDTLDRSVDTILETGATPLMALCFKPRVLFPTIDQDIVEPEDYEAWEELIVQLVRHYKERGSGIRYWEVGNEPDIGEDGGCPYRFQPESYTRYYRHTAAAVLRADPDARVGGPALASVHSRILPSLLEMCETEAVPLHFISWHIYSSDPQKIRGTIDHARSLLEKHAKLAPETMLDEWNMDLFNPPSDPRFQPCFVAEVAWQMKEARLDFSCYYHIRDYHVSQKRFARFMSPRGAAFMAAWWNRRPQWDGLFDYQSAVRPAYFAFKLLSRLTGERLRVRSSGRTVHGLATWDEEHRLYNLLLWNFSLQPESIVVELRDSPSDLRVRPLVLDAASPSSDENSRLLPEAQGVLKRENAKLETRLEPYGVRFWSLEGK
ncbi:MAG: hypothetical protein JXA90_09375 [Planctomycetes bacterium]|nr:hypothetical protein [Planctomycetota bacterium]